MARTLIPDTPLAMTPEYAHTFGSFLELVWAEAGLTRESDGQRFRLTLDVQRGDGALWHVFHKQLERIP